MKYSYIYLTIFFISLGNFVNADLYKWVDEEGVITFSQNKPTKVNSELVKIEKTEKTEKTEKSKVTNTKITDEVKNTLTDKANNSPDTSKKSPSEHQVNNCLMEKDLLRYISLNIPIYVAEGDKYFPEYSEIYYTYKGEKRVLSETEVKSLSGKIQNSYNSSCVDIERYIVAMEINRDKVKKTKQCNKAKEKLEELKNPDSHTIREEIDSYKKLVKSICKK